MIKYPFSIFEPFSDQLTISLFTREDDAQDEDRIAEIMDADGCAGLEQIHGNKTIVVREPIKRTEEADGMITDQKGLILTVRTADCQPFVVYAPDQNVTGVLHVGWKGLVAGAIPEFFKVLKMEWEIDPSDTFVGAGPSLCKECAEFTDPEKELPNVDVKFVFQNRVDLRGCASEEFFQLGVPEDHFERSSECTRCHPETYWTFRGGDRDAVMAGKTNVLACVLL